jgi:hypothetical protein
VKRDQGDDSQHRTGNGIVCAEHCLLGRFTDNQQQYQVATVCLSVGVAMEMVLRAAAIYLILLIIFKIAGRRRSLTAACREILPIVLGVIDNHTDCGELLVVR